ncbi:MAG: pilus assembly protein TadG-related protein [Pseudomonadota bacterium]
MTIFAVAMFMMMILVGGIGVDLMRNEMERTRMQATVDRAVLAAADLDQTLAPEDVVRDYFDKAGMSDYLSSVTVDQGLNHRTVTASANMSTVTQFMHLMGVSELPVPALAQAEERVSNVEISMVLDISGSMGWDNKMENLQDAATTFVDTVIREENENLISISLIPYTAQVNAGYDIFSRTETVHRHNYSYCVDFEIEDFSSTGLDLDAEYEQMQHFDAGWNYANPINNPGCPQQDFEEIVPFSQDATSLKDTINDYRARANTSIHLGMKWGVALLDPSFGPIVEDLAGPGENIIDDAFASRPAAYGDPKTLKTVVLMTDGQNVDTMRIQPWYYANSSHYAHWSRYPLHWYLNNYVSHSWNNWRYTKYTSTQADSMLEDICDAAKAQGIVVWSVGFEVTDFSAGIMEDCASSPSHFFRVEGIEITEAFEAIAKQINQLRLTQ